MLYRSTRGASEPVNFQKALLDGLAPDGGLYLPDSIPSISPQFLKALPQLSFQELSLEIASLWLDQEIDRKVLQRIVETAFQFDAPLVPVEGNIFALELFHGPTFAFKDFGARFMAQVLAEFVAGSENEITILVATSGDTGSAVANAFHNVDGIKVVLLFPSGKISEIQRKQMTTLGGNVRALEIEGSFDDCQRLVKRAFADSELKTQLQLSSANSINIARLLPQCFYYFRAVAQLSDQHPPIFSVPSGNFGNLTAGVIAKRMGLPVERFVAATNINDVVPQYLKSGKFEPRPSIQTISNAMDVGNPSNFERLQHLYQNDVARMSAEIEAACFTDHKTEHCIKHTYQETNYVLDPHGAVALLGLRKFMSHESGGIFLETAHPAKFTETVEPAIAKKIDIPETLKSCLSSPEHVTKLKADYEEFRSFLVG
jgi:threonine synthase